MIVWYGEIGNTGKWQAQRGTVVRECANAADAYVTAVALAGYRRGKVQKRVFPAPADAKPSTPAKAPKANDTANDHRVATLLAKGTKAIKAALKTGDYDDILSELFTVEKATKNRGTAIDAITARLA